MLAGFSIPAVQHCNPQSQKQNLIVLPCLSIETRL